MIGIRKCAGRSRLAFLALAALGALASGCAPPGAEAGAASGSAQTAGVRPLGNDLVGDSCRLRSDPRASATLPILRGFKIFCGRWQQESGLVYETAAAPAADGGVFDYAGGGWWRESLAARMDCRPPRQVTILDGVPAAVLDCNLLGGGWSYIALAARIGNSVYLAEGIPAALPPIETAMAGLAGGFDRLLETVAQRPRSNAIQDLEARLAGRIYGTGDLQDYRNLLEVAQYYNVGKEFANAEERYREALALHERLQGSDNPGRAYPLMHLALQLSNQERFDLADDLFKRAEALLGPDDKRERARLLSYRALDAANRQQKQQAYELAQTSADQRREIVAQLPPSRATGRSLLAVSGVRQGSAARGSRTTDADMREGTADADVPRGIELPNARRGALGDQAASLYITAAAQVQLGRLAEAERNIAEVLRIAKELTRSGDWLYPSVLALRSAVQSRRGDHAAASASLREAIAAQQKLAVNSRDEALAWLSLGETSFKAGRTAEGFEAYRAGFRIVEERRESLELVMVQPFLDAALAQGGGGSQGAGDLQAEMFAASQLVAGSITAQSIAHTAARFAAADPKRRQVIRDWEDARRERDQLARRFDAAQSNPEAPQIVRDRLQIELAEAVEVERERDREVLRAFPEYRRIVDAPTGATELRAALRADEALVSVLVGEARSYVFLLRPETVAVQAVNLPLSEASRLVDAIRAPFEDERELPHYDVALAHELYKRLFAPMEGQIAGVRHLITVPSGPLLSLPFGILVTEPHAPVRNYDYSQVKFLASRSAVSLSPGVSAFVKLRTQAKPSNAANAFLGFGDFVPLTDANRLLSRQALPASCRDDAGRLTQLPALPGSATEVQAVANAFQGRGADVRLQGAFSEAALRDLPLQNYRVLYFATHALLPREINCFVEPALIASLPPNAAGTDNGLVEASEIRELALDADLVVLSGCNTGGRGTEKGGESLAGLARAFFAAGARTVLASHWTVDNDATIALMRGSFAGADANLAEALQRSQVAMVQGVQQSHPWYWGAFSLVGDGARSGASLASLPSR